MWNVLLYQTNRFFTVFIFFRFLFFFFLITILFWGCPICCLYALKKKGFGFPFVAAWKWYRRGTISAAPHSTPKARLGRAHCSKKKIHPPSKVRFCFAPRLFQEILVQCIEKKSQEITGKVEKGRLIYLQWITVTLQGSGKEGDGLQLQWPQSRYPRCCPSTGPSDQNFSVKHGIADASSSYSSSFHFLLFKIVKKVATEHLAQYKSLRAPWHRWLLVTVPISIWNLSPSSRTAAACCRGRESAWQKGWR